MIISCPNCDKKFEIDKKLIPSNGRLLQCGSCNNKWFFKIAINEEKKEIEEKSIPIIENNKNLSEEIEENLSDEVHDNVEVSNNSKEEFTEKVHKKNNINFFKALIVIIISFIALILILDTFKVQFTIFIPNIEIILDNLYQSINDIKLFILDLIK